METINYGWIRDLPDSRDHKYTVASATSETLSKLKGILPSSIDLRTYIDRVPIYNQGSLGSCTANATCYAYLHMEMRQKNTSVFAPSRLFLYYNTRVIEGTVNNDSGAYLRNVMKSSYNTGICSEDLWKYTTSQFATKPPVTCYDQAGLCKTIEYLSVSQKIDQIKTAIYEGNPIVFGFDVYQSFKRIGSDGKMPIPNPSTEKQLGGHAVCIVGYDDSIQFNDGITGGVIVRNSWSSLWGDEGYFYMPYTVVTNSNLASDFWVIRAVTNPNLGGDPIPDPIPDPNVDWCQCQII